MGYSFFQNRECEYFPCHKTENVNKFNCLFCYCPLYGRSDCGGKYVILENGIKDCSNCLLPHYNYDYIIRKLGDNMVDIYFAKTREDAVIPSKDDENAGYDVYGCFDEDYIMIEPHKTVIIPTGIKSAVSKDFYFQIFERGSSGTKGMGQRCGVIDSGYRGEWFVPITNHNSDSAVVIAKKHVDTDRFENCIIYPYEKAICQAVVLPVPNTRVNEVSEDEIMEMTSKRGEGSLGSSKK